MKRILFLVSSADKVGALQKAAGFEFSEVADPYRVFTQYGIHIDFTSPNGGRVSHVNYHADQTNSRMFREGEGFARINQSRKLADIQLQEYDALFFPGGLAPLVDLSTDRHTKELIAQAYESGRVIGAVCHGPVALLGVTFPNGRCLLEGKRITSFTTAEEKQEGNSVGDVLPFLLDDAIRDEGAIHTSVFPFGVHLEIDGLLVTGQNPASATPVAEAMLRLMNK